MDKKKEKAINLRKEAGKRLAAFRNDVAKMERPEFSEYIGTSYDNQEAYENGRSFPQQPYWIALSDKFPEADVTFIMLGIPSKVQPYNFSRKVPIVNEVTAGRMNFHFADEEIQGYLFTTNDRDKDLFALKIDGDSMVPEIKDGDFVLCSPDRQFRNGDIHVVVTAESEATCKRVFKRKGGYDLVPENSEYENQFLQEEQIIKILPVVEIQRRIRT